MRVESKDPVRDLLESVLDEPAIDELRGEVEAGSVVICTNIADAAGPEMRFARQSADKVLEHLVRGQPVAVVAGTTWLLFRKSGELGREDPFRDNPLTGAGW